MPVYGAAQRPEQKRCATTRSQVAPSERTDIESRFLRLEATRSQASGRRSGWGAGGEVTSAERRSRTYLV